MISVDVVVLGGGPAGLAAAIACSRSGLKVALLERGREAATRNRYDRHDIVAGIGGAGLYSDGKFSFHPSATQLWQVQPYSLLREAYHWYVGLLSQFDVACPVFPDSDPQSFPGLVGEGLSFSSKRYLSVYLTFEQRLALISLLADTMRDSIITEAEVTKISVNGPLTTVEVEGPGDEAKTFVATKGVVVASGRFGPLLLQQFLPADNFHFRRIEVGARLEQPADDFFLRDAATVDPKHVWRKPGSLIEWRTFCCCRNGEIVTTRIDDILTVSGRSDGAPTENSSVGIHVRILDELLGMAIWTDIRHRFAGLESPIVEDVEIFMSRDDSDLVTFLGRELTDALRDGLRSLSTTFPNSLTGATLHGPTLEGIGWYPNLTKDLALSSKPIRIAGDATGIFRGITAALVSGYFCGLSFARETGARP